MSERRMDPDTGLEYDFRQFYELNTGSLPDEEITEYWMLNFVRYKLYRQRPDKYKLLEVC